MHISLTNVNVIFQIEKKDNKIFLPGIQILHVSKAAGTLSWATSLILFICRVQYIRTICCVFYVLGVLGQMVLTKEEKPRQE